MMTISLHSSPQAYDFAADNWGAFARVFSIHALASLCEEYAREKTAELEKRLVAARQAVGSHCWHKAGCDKLRDAAHECTCGYTALMKALEPPR